MQLIKPLIALALAASALASVHGPSKVHPNPPKPTPTPTCAKGTTALCCNELAFSSNQRVSMLMRLLHVPAPKTKNTLFGVTCNALGKGKNSCSGEEVCCKSNSWGGIIAEGCTSL
ncbi:hypothetical protein SCHPADRAFT_943527 [Schizopora paradoxa]|uniref:Hydrophobin n=1 Tax=Schizopora paradoxa TaxID=27342 RepID=A0A0H2RXU3_9AGAM|nr:hypothetical protein SCHPADRAFT_943527 [Schizopora paradoxa]